MMFPMCVETQNNSFSISPAALDSRKIDERGGNDQSKGEREWIDELCVLLAQEETLPGETPFSGDSPLPNAGPE